jgi:hypothetical protein
MARCRREIADIESLIRSGHSDVAGLCQALVDWNCELRLIAKHRPVKCTGSAFNEKKSARIGE